MPTSKHSGSLPSSRPRRSASGTPGPGGSSPPVGPPSTPLTPPDKVPNPSPDQAKTFTGGKYTKVTTTDDNTVLYRVYGGGARQIAGFWSRTPPMSPDQAQRDLAILPEWGGKVEKQVAIRVPKGATFFEGTAAPQTATDGSGLKLPGGGNQVLFTTRDIDPSWIISSGPL